MTVHIDVSQLVDDPRRSGIQRAERELIRHWPGPLAPCRFDAAIGAMRALPAQVLEALCAEEPPGGTATERLRLERMLVPGPVVQPARLLNAELFTDEGRAAYYAAPPAGVRAYWLAYDFLPVLEPGRFGPGAALPMMPFLRAMRHVPRLAFISERTRTDCARVLGRPMDGPVIPMGADGLGLERQAFHGGRRSFVMLGSIERRKNADLVVAAFRALWAAGVPAELTMLGATLADGVAERSMLRGLAGEARFHAPGHMPDAVVREALRGARALVFPSEAEGFGIPPMEALHAGIPAIVAASLPALAGVPGLGQVRLAPVTAESIAAAVQATMEDAFAARLWDEAAGLALPGWAEVAQRVAAWVRTP